MKAIIRIKRYYYSLFVCGHAWMSQKWPFAAACHKLHQLATNCTSLLHIAPSYHKLCQLATNCAICSVYCNVVQLGCRMLRNTSKLVQLFVVIMLRKYFLLWCITKLGQTWPWEVKYRLQLAAKSNQFTKNRYVFWFLGWLQCFQYCKMGAVAAEKSCRVQIFGHWPIKTIKQNSVLSATWIKSLQHLLLLIFTHQWHCLIVFGS